MNILEILYIFLILIFLEISYQDWLTCTYSYFLLFWLCIFSIFFVLLDISLVKNFTLSGSIGFGIPFGLSKFSRKPSLGKGDLYILALSGIWVPWNCWPSIFLFLGIGGTFWGIVYSFHGQKTFPFTPLIIAASLPYLYAYCWKIV